MWQQVDWQRLARPIHDITKEVEVHPPKWQKEFEEIDRKYREFISKQEIANLKEDIKEDIKDEQK